MNLLDALIRFLIAPTMIGGLIVVVDVLIGGGNVVVVSGAALVGGGVSMTVVGALVGGGVSITVPIEVFNGQHTIGILPLNEQIIILFLSV